MSTDKAAIAALEAVLLIHDNAKALFGDAFDDSAAGFLAAIRGVPDYRAAIHAATASGPDPRGVALDPERLWNVVMAHVGMVPRHKHVRAETCGEVVAREYAADTPVTGPEA